MSLLRTPVAGRILRTAGAAQQRAPAAFARYYAQTAGGTQLVGKDESQPLHHKGDSNMENHPGARETGIDHGAPDYNAVLDYSSTAFSPVPKRVMDGSEDSDIVPAAVLSGAPIELQARQVRIFKPTKTATQSGDWHSHHWRMDWDVLGKGHRWENPLMGWQSSGDAMQGTAMFFKTREEAIAFAKKQGYEYFVQEPNQRKFTPKAYANNFLYSSKKLKMIRTK